jgi:hypothetical protein
MCIICTILRLDMCIICTIRSPQNDVVLRPAAWLDGDQARGFEALEMQNQRPLLDAGFPRQRALESAAEQPPFVQTRHVSEHHQEATGGGGKLVGGALLARPRKCRNAHGTPLLIRPRACAR